MRLTQEAFLGLKRHFLGALSEPPSLWVVPVPEPRLLLASRDALQGNLRGCSLDFGTVESPGETRGNLRVANLGPETLTIKLGSSPAWLRARWRDNSGDAVHLAGSDVELELIATHDALEETPMTGCLELKAESLTGESRISEIQVRLTARRLQPVGVFSFRGSSEPGPVDFGVLDIAASGPEVLESCTLSFENRTSVPLKVSFADLAAWLVFEVDGYQRRGPAAGRFFERDAPFQVDLRPVRVAHFLGAQQGRLLLRTNDSRPDYQQVELDLSAQIVSSRPYLEVIPPERVRIAPGEQVWVEAMLKNHGQESARLREARSPGLHIPDWPVVPANQDGQPGTAALRIRVAPQLPPGHHALSFTVSSRNSDQRDIAVPIRVEVVAPGETAEPPAPPPPSLFRPGLVIAALVVLLLVLGVTVFF
jgi:hypothetical protein